MNALAAIGEFFAFFVELFKSLINGITGIFSGNDATAA